MPEAQVALPAGYMRRTRGAPPPWRVRCLRGIACQAKRWAPSVCRFCRSRKLYAATVRSTTRTGGGWEASNLPPLLDGLGTGLQARTKCQARQGAPRPEHACGIGAAHTWQQWKILETECARHVPIPGLRRALQESVAYRVVSSRVRGGGAWPRRPSRFDLRRTTSIEGCACGI